MVSSVDWSFAVPFFLSNESEMEHQEQWSTQAKRNCAHAHYMPLVCAVGTGA
jgi:hypothetical protein